MAIGNQLDLSQMYAKQYLAKQLAFTLATGDYIVFQNDTEIKFFDGNGKVKQAAVELDEVARTAEEIVYLVQQHREINTDIAPILAKCAAINVAILALRQRVTQLETDISEQVGGNTRSDRRKNLTIIKNELAGHVAEIEELQRKLRAKTNLISELERQITTLTDAAQAQAVVPEEQSPRAQNLVFGAPKLGDYYGSEERPMPAGEWGWLEPDGATAKNQAKILMRTTTALRGQAAADIARWYSMDDLLDEEDQDIDNVTDEWIVFGVEMYPINVRRKVAAEFMGGYYNWGMETVDDDYGQERYLYVMDVVKFEMELVKATKNNTSTFCLMMAQVGRGDKVRVSLTDKEFDHYWFAVK